MARSLALGLYLLLAERGAAMPAPARPARPEGRLLWVHAGAGTRPETLRQLLDGLGAARDGLALLVTTESGPPAEGGAAGLHEAAPPDHLPEVRAFLAHWRPDAGLFLGNSLPPALVTEAHDRGIPLVLADAGFDQAAIPVWRRGIVGSVLVRFGRILARDAESVTALRRIGGRALPVELVGRIDEVPEPLACDEAEREAMADLLRARPVWLAAACPEAEEDAVIDAHVHAMSQAHRLLLILSPADPARAPILARRLGEEFGLIVASRAQDEDPLSDVQVLVTDGPAEMGLWYRLAPVTFLGGSLAGPAIRPPTEAATLGSAIVHGPRTGVQADAVQRLSEARATRPIASADDLRAAIADLIAPDKAATLAGNAWLATSGGAEAVERIVAAALGALDRDAPVRRTG
ncbi:MAG: 3-deoxy-D-manno-octulosonic acid transferase [Proteobacteria bacterium]|nr:3-deoxy-D-manno-octulosonic acid transferase [Pseudomonadota bacterium]MBS0572140.1 3-deoxy-D-manno-octulosonic acid transferase [Pseudomonadota bacterium]